MTTTTERLSISDLISLIETQAITQAGDLAPLTRRYLAMRLEAAALCLRHWTDHVERPATDGAAPIFRHRRTDHDDNE